MKTKLISKTLSRIAIASLATLITGCTLFDNTPPATPSIIANSTISSKNSVNVNIKGEVGCKIIINNKDSGKIIGKSEKNSITLNLGESDGETSFDILLEDEAGNRSKAVNVKITRDTTSPKAPTIKLLSENSNSVKLEISGEDGSEVFLSNVSKGFIKYSKLKVDFDLKGKDGEKSFDFTLKDKAGNISKATNVKLIKDTTPYAIPTIINQPTITNQPMVQLLISGDKGSSIIIDGNVEHPLPLGKDNNLKLKLMLKKKDGKNDFKIASIDAYKNISKFVKFTIEKDSTAPEAVVVKSVVTKTNADVEKAQITAEAGTELFVNGKKCKFIPKSGTLSIDLNTKGEDGKKEFILIVKDKANNSSKESKIVITKDATAPKTPINLTKTPEYTNKDFLEIELQGEAKSLIVINEKEYGKIGENGKQKLNLPLKAEGEHSFCIKLKDDFNNISESLTLKTVKDVTPPKNPTVEIPKFSKDDFLEAKIKGEAGAKILINGEATKLQLNSRGEATKKINISGLDGKKSVEFKLVDFAGNVSGNSTVSTIKDVTAPKMPIISKTPKFTNTNEMDIKISGEEGSSILVDSEDSEIKLTKDMTLTLDLSGKDGEKVFDISLMDKAKNESKVKSIKIYKDSIVPKKPKLSNDSKVTNNDETYITVKGEPGSRVFINNQDTKMFVNSNEIVKVPVNTSGLDGDIKFEVKLADNADNFSEANTIIVKKDIKAPTKPRFDLIPLIIGNSNNHIVVVGEKGSSVIVNGENTKMIINSSGKVKVPLNTSGVDGKKLYKISLIDSAGNQGEEVELEIEKDVTPPSEVVVKLSDIIVSGNETVATVEGENGCTLYVNNTASGTFKNGETISVILDLSGKDGEKIYDFTQKDSVENESIIVSHKIIKDTTSPDMPTLKDYPSTTNKNEIDIEINSNESGVLVINDGVVPIGKTAIVTLDLGETDGEKSFDITLTDFAKNSSETLKLNILKDSTPPKEPFISSIPVTVYSDSETIEISGEAGATVFVNGYNSKIVLNSSGKAEVELNTSGKDGMKTFEITLKDRLGNESKAFKIEVLKKASN